MIIRRRAWPGMSAPLAMAATLLLAIVVALVIADRLLGAQRRDDGALWAGVGVHSADELGKLAAAFDDMADQLEQAFSRERALEAGRRELITAVSHDLRTPLSNTRVMVEALADSVVTDPA